MAAYLADRPPVRDQWYAKRNRPLTGCTVLHSTESVFDEIGEDTGAEGVAEFIRKRMTPGSYHDVVDSDSVIELVDYNHGAYHDGTGSNNWALSLAFACRTVDWNAMAPAKRKAMLRNGAIAFARQQAYRRSIGAPTTDLRLITKAQSDRGESGFTYHGWRDPSRRSDPGTIPPNRFPFDEFIAECRAALAHTPEEDDMFEGDDRAALSGIAALLGQHLAPAIGRLDVHATTDYPFVLYQDTDPASDHRTLAVLAGPGVWWPVPSTTPQADYLMVIRHLRLAGQVVEVPTRGWWAFAEQMWMLRGATLNVDTAAIEAKLTDLIGGFDEEAFAAIARLVNDEDDRRARDGDPATGPVS